MEYEISVEIETRADMAGAPPPRLNRRPRQPGEIPAREARRDEHRYRDEQAEKIFCQKALLIPEEES